MEELKTITQVTRFYGVSTRTLRYYEQIGLLPSQHVDGYSYRVYDEKACRTLEQIMILRKLRMSLKQIQTLLNDNDMRNTMDILVDSITELTDEISSLSTIRSILMRFVSELRSKTGLKLTTDLLSDASILSMISPLAIDKEMSVVSKNKNKEDNAMDDLCNAATKRGKLSEKEIRIVYLPPCAVAAYQYEGDDPEMHVNQVIDEFVRSSDLVHKKPDLRHYGFNAPNPKDESGYHGYEMWVTIPDDMEVPAPLVKKQFDGGLYAAYMIHMGEFDEWGRICEWVKENKTYEYCGSYNPDNMFGWMEEHLNYVNHVDLPNTEPEDMQLDLLMPVRPIESEKKEK